MVLSKVAELKQRTGYMAGVVAVEGEKKSAIIERTLSENRYLKAKQPGSFQKHPN